MVLSYNFLKKHFNFNYTSEEIYEIFTKHSIEIEEMYNISDIKGIITGKIISVKKHPSSNKLKICNVEYGQGIKQILCGADNVYEGMITAIAPIGTKFSEDFIISEREMAGELSQGMICAFSEIVNISVNSKYYHDGVIDFGKDLKIGQEVRELLSLDDVIFELGITPNRVDLLNMIGQILETKAVLRLPVNNFDYDINFENDTNEETDLEILSVQENNNLCEYFSLTRIETKDLRLTYFEEYMLMINGISLVNPIVDLGNFAMLLCGQPVNFYDADKIKSKKIKIRYANENEEFVGLNKKLINLNEEDIVISSDEGILSLAGVMSSNEFSVDDSTENVILEIGRFNMSNIRKTARRYNLSTDSSYRNERGVSREATFDTNYFIKRYVQKQGAKVYISSVISNVSLDETIINFSLQELNSMSGYEFTINEVEHILDLLTLEYDVEDSEFKVQISLRHNDFKIKEDLFEEIIRIFGYDNLVKTLPKIKRIIGLDSFEQTKLNLKNFLVNQGFNQFLTYSLVSKKENETFTLNYDLEDISLMLPQSKDREVMRNNLTSSTVKSIIFNHKNKIENIKSFEIGEIFSRKFDKNQKNMLSIGISGNEYTSFNKGTYKMDFYYLKNILYSIFKKFGFDENNIRLKVSDISNSYHPYRSASIYYNDIYIGVIGNILDKKYSEIYTLEIDFDFIVENQKYVTEVKEYSIYPSTNKDFSIIVDKNEEFFNVSADITSLNIGLVKNIILVDEFKDEKIGKDKKSLLVRVILNDTAKTLTEKDITVSYNLILDKLNEKYNIQ